MASRLRYLTVQDVLWINLQVTRTVNRYRFAPLEEATYYQYAYGGSEDPLTQARRFQQGFLKMAPIEAGNEATAFVAAAAFLVVNGYSLGIQDGDTAAFQGASPDEHAHPDGLSDTVQQLIARFPRTIASLGGTPVEIVADGATH
jgi:death-on-curing protein